MSSVAEQRRAYSRFDARRRLGEGPIAPSRKRPARSAGRPRSCRPAGGRRAAVSASRSSTDREISPTRAASAAPMGAPVRISSAAARRRIRGSRPSAGGKAADVDLGLAEARTRGGQSDVAEARPARSRRPGRSRPRRRRRLRQARPARKTPWKAANIAGTRSRVVVADVHARGEGPRDRGAQHDRLEVAAIVRDARRRRSASMVAMSRTFTGALERDPARAALVSNATASGRPSAPLNAGLRFSRLAARPSRASSDSKSCCCSSRSRARRSCEAHLRRPSGTARLIGPDGLARPGARTRRAFSLTGPGKLRVRGARGCRSRARARASSNSKSRPWP
jgi:hypothetical protein